MEKNVNRVIILIAFMLNGFCMDAQINPYHNNSTFGRGDIPGTTSVNPNSNGFTGNHIIQQQNQVAMQRMGYKPLVVLSSNSTRQPNFQNSYSNNQTNSRIAVQQIIDEENNQIVGNSSQKKTINIQYELPSLKNVPSTNHYRSAFDSLKQMEDTFSIKKANFLVENAFFENKLKEETFEEVVSKIGLFIKTKMKDFNYDTNSNLAKNLLLLRFFSDTLKTNYGAEHLPFKYDFDDYMGNNDWASMFVLKLLSTNKGQCHSLPLLYLILAEEIEAEAYLSFSPNHSYIKFQNDMKDWINVELTNGMLTTDAFVLQSGYVKSEALQNKIYLKPLNETELLSQMMVDLAQGYSVKFGYDDFVEEVLNKAIDLYPNNINAQMMLSDYRTIHFKYVQQQANINPNNINYFPKAKDLLDKMLAQYDKVDDLGFSKMPAKDYEKWLKSLQEAKNKQESEKLMINLNKSIEGNKW